MRKHWIAVLGTLAASFCLGHLPRFTLPSPRTKGSTGQTISVTPSQAPIYFRDIAAVGDFDNDGLPDLYVTGCGHNVLYHNLGGCKFEDVTEKAGVRVGGFSTGAPQMKGAALG